MKSIFLNKWEEQIKRVYSEEMICELNTVAGLERKVYTKEDILASGANDAEYIFSTWGMPVFTEEEIKTHLPNLKAIFYSAGSVQSFAREFLNCGVAVFSAWAANGVPVAEYTVAQIVLANKGFFTLSRCMKDDGFDLAHASRAEYIGNFGAKVGIIGAGMIGKMVINMLKNYKLEVMVFDPFLPDKTAAELEVKKVSLETLFSECDVVSNHLANNPQTVGMLNEKLFASMKENATFINTGRGAQVVEEDLIKVLSSRPDLTAILDVTDPEPPIPESEFYSLPNCILTPHIAGSNGYEVHRMAEYMRDEFISFTSGEACKYQVTLKMLETMA